MSIFEEKEEERRAMDTDLNVRDQALFFLVGQHITDHSFFDRIQAHIAEIPLEPGKLQHCLVCESAACGICGACHVLDSQFLFVGHECPASVETHEQTPCVAWSKAYRLLRRAEKSLQEKEGK